MARVLFVSKPVVPPFFDGTKCLVRDVATHLERHDAIVLGTRDAPELVGLRRVAMDRVYASAGAYSPALAENARATLHLLTKARADVFHFVFAPNARSSRIARLVKAARRRPVVQTVASSPSEFSPAVFFGDAIVAQSRWTRDRIAAAYESRGMSPPRLDVVPPPIAGVPRRSEAALANVRAALDLPENATVLTYPGDLEVSRGAETVARAVPFLVSALPDVVVVFACRKKTEDAPRLARALMSSLPPRNARFTHEVDLPALLALSRAVLFPVEDLRGKVDVPISLLEAMRLEVPVVTLSGNGPLSDLEGVARCSDGDAEGLASAALRLVRDVPYREAVVVEASRFVDARHDAGVVARAYESIYDDLLRAS